MVKIKSCVFFSQMEHMSGVCVWDFAFENTGVFHFRSY
jgi:hypothetical protein